MTDPSRLCVNTAARTYAAAWKSREKGLQARAMRFVLDRFGAVSRTDGFRWLLRESTFVDTAAPTTPTATSTTPSGAAMGGFVGALQELWDCVPYDASLTGHSAVLNMALLSRSPLRGEVGGGRRRRSRLEMLQDGGEMDDDQ
jgi:hypothetical protein